jgi:hypothetical protein
MPLHNWGLLLDLVAWVRAEPQQLSRLATSKASTFPGSHGGTQALPPLVMKIPLFLVLSHKKLENFPTDQTSFILAHGYFTPNTT